MKWPSFPTKMCGIDRISKKHKIPSSLSKLTEHCIKQLNSSNLIEDTEIDSNHKEQV